MAFYTWLDPQRMSYGFGYGSPWSLAGLAHAPFRKSATPARESLHDSDGSEANGQNFQRRRSSLLPVSSCGSGFSSLQLHNSLLIL